VIAPGLAALALGGAASVALAATLAVAAPGGPAAPSDPAASAVQYAAPLPSPLDVVRGFDPPPTEYGPGHRGVDLRAAAGATVGAAAAGRVEFAGQVAGHGVVVVAHRDGIRTEYEPVRPAVETGDRVRPGQLIGTVHGRHNGCAASCLHWGARRGDSYLDPLGLLAPLGPVVLLPDSRGG
jgi:murein DD-endopeptidase MepM/ murein hydrolase activator NlpD